MAGLSEAMRKNDRRRVGTAAALDDQLDSVARADAIGRCGAIELSVAWLTAYSDHTVEYGDRVLSCQYASAWMG